MIYVLDTFALLAFFWKEAGYTKVEAALQKAVTNQGTVHMSRINLGEMFYMAWKKRSQQIAEQMLLDAATLPIIIEPATDTRIMAAARLKANHPISYADAFALGLGVELGATVFTNDPEFKAVAHLITIEWVL